jgi:hypothetical protein
MERGNTKHGPIQDEELARETQGMVHGNAHGGHSEEWRESEPVDEAVPPVVRRPGNASLSQDIADTTGQGETPAANAIEVRSTLARLVTRDLFPAQRHQLVARLTDADAPDDVINSVRLLPEKQSFASLHQVLEALGINSPETRSR